MITFSQVTKRFGDGTVAVDDVSFHIEPSELVVITGPSGSGKTTLMRLLTRDYPPTSGVIEYKGERLDSIAANNIPYHRRKIGVVFQDYRLLPELNIWENIALPLSIMGKSEGEIESRVTDLLNLVRLIDRALVFPKQLSGGEAQRVSIARALATGPSVIFADEPTGNLDKKSSLGIVKLLQQINSLGTTVLIATHDVTLLDVLDSERHLELEGGKLVRDTKPSQPPAVEQAVEPSESEDKSEPEGKSKPEPEPEPELNPKKQPKKTKADKKAAKKAATKKEAKEKTEEKPLSAEFAEVTNEAQTEKRSILGSIGKKLPSLKLPFFGKNKTPPKASKPVDQPTQPEEHEEHHE